MTDKTTPAFPVHEQYLETGLTIRDYFAAKAMSAMAWTPASMAACAAECYRVADAMLRAREGV